MIWYMKVQCGAVKKESIWPELESIGVPFQTGDYIKVLLPDNYNNLITEPNIANWQVICSDRIKSEIINNSNFFVTICEVYNGQA